jgi:uncharacterized membrane protein
MSEPDSSEWTRPRTLMWAILLGLSLVGFGGSFLKAFRPPDDYTTDFIQEWLSARNYFAGEPIYEDQLVALARHWPEFRPSDPETFLRWNAHPPAAVLVALPFAKLGYQDAQLAWNIVTFALFVFSIALVWRELVGVFYPWLLACVLSLILVALPIHTSLQHGQLNFLLTFLVTLGWVADRRGHPLSAGILVGLAAGLKLFPGFLLLYFLASRRWHAVLGFAIGALTINTVALISFGVNAFETYFREVIPSLQAYQSGWRNLSINGWSLRLLDPHLIQADATAYRNPALAKVLTAVLTVLVIILVAWQAWSGRKNDDPDRGWASAIVGMMLVSPITWHHYLVLLLVPLGILAQRLNGRLFRVLGWMVLVVLILGAQVFVALSMGLSTAQLFGPAHHVPMSQRVNLIAISMHSYALLLLLFMTLLIPNRLTPAARIS